jgi:outer membrane protein TolC
VLARKRQLIEAEQSVSQSKSEKGLNADLMASFGLSQSGNKFDGIYVDPQQHERVRLGIEIPIMDWGLARGRYKMAQSAQEVVKTNVAQAEMDFEQEVLLQVMQFNLQDDQLIIAAKADTIARMRYEVSKQRFLIGKISVLDLNVALQEKDVATRAYIAALRNYWNYFFNMRSLTLYDWIDDESLSEEFDSLIR